MTNSPGLVLSGGGTRGAFEAGAVNLLVHIGSPLPEYIAGASAGAICGSVLAQARGREEFAHYAAVLRADVLAMTHINKVFERSGWVEQLAGTPLASAIKSALMGETRPSIGHDPGVIDDPLAHEGVASHTPAWKGVAAAALHPVAVHRARKAYWDDPASVLKLDPLEAALRGQSDSGIEAVDEAKIARPGLTLRLAITPLQAGVPRYVTETGIVVESDSHTVHVNGRRPGVIEGVLASSSVPVVFAPRTIGDDVYVDGGVLRNMPVEAAVHAGAGDIIAISANTIAPPPFKGDITKATLLTVSERFGVLEFYDQVRRSLRYPLADGATMTSIAPTMDIVGMFEVELGLLAIDVDYGWLRAAEATGLDAQTQIEAQVVSDQITTGRQRAWHLEDMVLTAEAAGESVPKRVSMALASAKQMVADGVAAWQGFGLPLPVGATQWAHNPEVHTPPTA